MLSSGMRRAVKLSSRSELSNDVKSLLLDIIPYKYHAGFSSRVVQFWANQTFQPRNQKQSEKETHYCKEKTALRCESTTENKLESAHFFRGALLAFPQFPNEEAKLSSGKVFIRNSERNIT